MRKEKQRQQKLKEIRLKEQEEERLAKLKKEEEEELAQSKEEILIQKNKTKMEISFYEKNVVELHEQAKQELKKGNK